MNKLFYPAIFQVEEEGGYSVFFPDIEGCNTQGETVEETYDMAFDALGLTLSYLQDNNLTIPKPSKPQDIQLDNNQYVVVIQFDMLEYLKKNESRAVKKTLSIPSWLNEAAMKQNINFSQVLQEALMNKMNI
ncbi:type II toxin-antitoxin system HicB family antitoxin [Anaerocolumna sp. AGMB13025]|uniref:type II toxin-antitoxin system HicB family antitoxin n=1 Tax=Anaerocolumna sp. AGMB13025 TaxID=3039116 RepID=UPI00241DFF1C|nr:type II toxin-antitoxin system HicB family antitoxin [Anaerocolumna sp. AGMB13025]WFR57478.1 type II toxin-antitoxin system HicB family antitoxin [Anaerocolumna sp. AGMB13025]